jgi:hypothetical protein
MHLSKRSTLLALSVFMSLSLSPQALAAEWTKVEFPGMNPALTTPYMGMKRLVNNGKDAWLLQDNGQPWKWSGGGWVKTGTCCVADISLGADGTLWALSTGTRQLMKLDPTNDNRWLKDFPARALKQIAAVNGTTVYGIGAKDGAVYSLSDAGWTKHSCCVAKLAAGAQGELWAINAKNGLLRWNGSQWLQQPGTAVEVAVRDSSYVATLDSKGNASVWTGSGWKPMEAPVNAPGKPSRLKLIAITPLKVWAISKDNWVWVANL